MLCKHVYNILRAFLIRTEQMKFRTIPAHQMPVSFGAELRPFGTASWMMDALFLNIAIKADVLQPHRSREVHPLEVRWKNRTREQGLQRYTPALKSTSSRCGLPLQVDNQEVGKQTLKSRSTKSRRQPVNPAQSSCVSWR
jgi:hypothetical protein